MPYTYGEHLAGCRHASKHNLCRCNLLPAGFSRLFPVRLKARDLTPLLNTLLIPGIVLGERVLLFEELNTRKHVFLPHGACFCIERGACPKIRVKEEMNHITLMRWNRLERRQLKEAQRELVCGLDLERVRDHDGRIGQGLHDLLRLLQRSPQRIAFPLWLFRQILCCQQDIVALTQAAFQIVGNLHQHGTARQPIGASDQPVFIGRACFIIEFLLRKTLQLRMALLAIVLLALETHRFNCSALSLLATGATCVTLGWSASVEATIDVSNLIRTGRTTLYGLNFYAELDRRAASEDLAWLAQKVAEQQLRTPIEVEASWHDIGEVAQRLLQRQFTGKAVLHLA